MDCQSAKTFPSGDTAIDTNSVSRESFTFRLTGWDQPAVWAEVSREHKLRRGSTAAIATVRVIATTVVYLICELQTYSRTRMPPIQEFRTRGIFKTIVPPIVLIEYTPGLRECQAVGSATLNAD